jgi:hypothetical protein
MFSHERHCGTRGGLGGRAVIPECIQKNSALLDPELGDTTALIRFDELRRGSASGRNADAGSGNGVPECFTATVLGPIG